ncbi:MAG: N-acetylneuraminate synthase family protein [Gaiellaceae bacterium]
MHIADFDTDARVLVVAEIGNNHEGDVGVARELVEAAAEAGADAVKFQTFRTEHYVSRLDAERFTRLEGFRLSFEEFEELAALAHNLGLLFVSTPFDLESAAFLGQVADAIKIASGDNDFEPLLVRAAGTRRPMIVSAGLAEIEAIRRTVGLVRREWAGEDHGLAVLHCVSAYPVPPEEAHLRAVTALADELDCVVGYSDHTIGVDAAPLAVALGARVIEKHFTLDKSYSDFRDHLLSADPLELTDLVRRIRLAETLLGAATKRVQPSEESGVVALRRSIAALRDLPAGHAITAEDLTWLRPGGGLRPGQEEALLGRRLRRAVSAGEQLGVDDTE